jgi:hypothetical protein
MLRSVICMYILLSIIPSLYARSIAAHTPFTFGSCSELPLGQLTEPDLSHAGVTSIQTCAQYAFDLQQVSKNINFVSFSDSSCTWFSACGCVAGGVCGTPAATTVSAEISDIIKPAKVATSVKVKSGNFQVQAAGPAAQASDPLHVETEECADMFSDLMKTFQSKCEFSRSRAYQRFVSAVIVVLSLGLCGAGFGIAAYLDRKAKLTS